MNRIRFSLALFLLPTFAFPHGAGEMSSNVGPDQGITEYKKGLGFKLSPEARKQFGMQSQKMEGPSAEIPNASVVVTMMERNLYRIRDGYIWRIDFKEISRKDGKTKITSPALQKGDEVVTAGLGFLRVAEMSLGVDSHADDEHGDEHGDESHSHQEGEAHHD